MCVCKIKPLRRAAQPDIAYGRMMRMRFNLTRSVIYFIWAFLWCNDYIEKDGVLVCDDDDDDDDTQAFKFYK